MSIVSLAGIENDGVDDYLSIDDQPTKSSKKKKIVESEPSSDDSAEIRDDHIRRIKLENTLRLTYQVFPNDLKQYKSKIAKLDKLSIEDLDLLASEIDVVLSMGSQFDRLNQFFYGGMKALEEISKLTPVNLTGFSAKVESNETIKKDIALVCVRACSKYGMTPETRLASTLTLLAFETHMVNRHTTIANTNELKSKLSEPVNTSNQINIPTPSKQPSMLDKLNNNYADLD